MPIKRLGVLTPSSNTVVEPETVRLLPADGSVTAHFARVRVVQISDSDASLRQFELEPMLAAADLLADAAVDLMVWNGTAAAWLGFERDQRLVEAIAARTGIPATSALLAINQRLRRLGARRLGFVTPYVESIEARILANYRAAGFSTPAALRRDIVENTAIAAITPHEIAQMARQVSQTGVDAIVILCTNLAGAGIAKPLEAELGVPVLDSVAVAIEHSLERMS
jgi:maleate isomerase